MNEEQINEALKVLNIPTLPSEPNYWLIRTESGIFYDTFKKEGYVSIGFDEINLNDIKNKDIKELKTIIAATYPDNKRPGTTAGQLVKFSNKVQIGDIILIPDKNSKNLCIGQVTSSVYQVEEKIKKDEIEDEIYTYQKRIKVTWFAEIPKIAFDIYIFRLLNSHQCIVDIAAYKNIINRMVFPIYRQDDKIHISLYVKTTKEISLKTTKNILDMPSSLIQLYNKYTNNNLDDSDISLKSTINSPGILEIIGSTPTLLIVAAFLIIIIGGKFTNKSKTNPDGSTEKETSLETNGLIKPIFDFIHQKKNDDLEELKTKTEIGFKMLEIQQKNINTLDNPEKITIQEPKKINKSKKEDPNQQTFFDD